MLDSSIASVLDRIRCISDEAGLDHFIHELRDHFSVTHAALFLMAPDGGVRTFGTFPSEWAEPYFGKGLDRHDPVVMGCYNSFVPVDWQDLDWSTRQAQMILHNALSHGLGPQGYTVPIRGPRGQYAALTLCGGGSAQEWRQKWARESVDLVTICHFLNARVLELEGMQTADLRKGLSPREIDAMSFLARGMSRAQIAATLEISEHTLRAYIESARRKLDAANTTHAVARAISHGFILV